MEIYNLKKAKIGDKVWIEAVINDVDTEDNTVSAIFQSVSDEVGESELLWVWLDDSQTNIGERE